MENKAGICPTCANRMYVISQMFEHTLFWCKTCGTIADSTGKNDAPVLAKEQRKTVFKHFNEIGEENG